ncbi:hypothetical protein C2E25_17175 [Geothermobacter hydrogeniphilus]|uniref:Uncharacterized protein n=1 Tax=Geothermobacter hydrogeniphilus TaxID=1969733 RepID=A0A2K2H5D7_9BACT|nr:hypothetical protein [Geothermobacter hydrogeniphilus]PNU18528.1 hypothetical protein C2E25_17175 [Geothermobacter hydrogeniphilus]
MHLLHSLFYLVVTMLLTAGYLLLAGGLLYAVRSIIRRMFAGQGRKPKRTTLDAVIFEPDKRRKALSFLLIVFLVYHLAFYIQQRQQWMGRDNAHLEAKEYFVAGQVLYGFRALLTRFIHPDIVVLWPLNALQEKIYSDGVKLLPKKDGERYVWQQLWFLYPYTRTLRETWDGDDNKYSPNMVKLLDRYWDSLQGMATQPFADAQMKHEQYYRNFPALAFYYNLKKAQHYESVWGALQVLAQDPVQIERTNLLIRWLGELRSKWQDAQTMRNVLKKHPLIAVARQEALLSGLEFAMETLILNKQFRCDHPYVQLYVKTRAEFVGSREHPSPLMRLRNAKQREYHYDARINWVGARFYKRMLPKYCGIEVAGEEEFFNTKNWDDKKLWDDRIQSIFEKEFQLIEEAIHGN